MKLTQTLTLLAATAFTASAAFAQSALVVGFDFNQFDANSFSTVDLADVSQISSSHSDLGLSGTVSYGGQNGSSSFGVLGLAGPNPNAAGGFNGTGSVNQVINTPARTQPSSPLFLKHFDTVINANALGFVSNGTTDVSGLTFAINFPATDVQEMVLTYAASAQAGAANTITWSYDIGGGPVAIGDTDNIGSTYGVQTVTIPSAANFQSSVTLLGTLGSATQGNMLAIDNIQVIGIPEPSAFAALAGVFALTGLMVRRRR